MTSFFITGANGWLGHNLIEHLIEQKISSDHISTFCKEGDDVKFLKDRGVKIFFGDVGNISSVQDFLRESADAVVIHLAGLIHPQFKTSDFFDTNYLGTKHIVETAQKFGAKKVVVMSSNSPIGCNKSNSDTDIFTEESPFHPYMKYGQSKFLMEKYLQNFSSHNLKPAITVIRSPWFYGPNQPTRQTLFFRMIKEGKFPIIGNGENKRSMAFTQNLAQGIMLAALNDKANGQTYWIADEKPYSMNQIVSTVKKVLEKEFSIECKTRNIKLPSIISDCAYLADLALQKVGFYHQKTHVLSEMNKNIFCSVEKAKKELGYNPQFELYSGMRSSLEWCLKNNITF